MNSKLNICCTIITAKNSFVPEWQDSCFPGFFAQSSASDHHNVMLIKHHDRPKTLRPDQFNMNKQDKDIEKQNTPCSDSSESAWLQIKGDPSIREQVFQQTRRSSEFDRQVDRVLHIVERLFLERGVFHVIIHFSSNQLSCWFLNDPFRYKVFVGSTVLDDGFVDSFQAVSPWIGASIHNSELRDILLELKRLRLRDEHLYLRNGSINIINGMVGLSFSCDGTHYIVANEFQRLSMLI